MSDSLPPQGLYSPWNSPGQNTEVGSHSLLQGIFQMQGSNPGLLHCRQLLHQLSHQGSSRILEWVACSFSRGSSQPRNRTRVSCIVGVFFTRWATREAPKVKASDPNVNSLGWDSEHPYVCKVLQIILTKVEREPPSPWPLTVPACGETLVNFSNVLLVCLVWDVASWVLSLEGKHFPLG